MLEWNSSITRGTRRLLARRCLGNDTADDYIQWAVTELVAGAEAPSVAILAGLGRPLDRWEITFYFERALGELGLRLPEPRGFLLEFARGIAADIFAGAVSPQDGAWELYPI